MLMKAKLLLCRRRRLAVGAAIAAAALSFLAVAHGSERGGQAEAAQKTAAAEDEVVDLVPVMGNARIEVGLAPVYETTSQMVNSTASLDKVESPSSAELFFDRGGSIEGLSGLDQSGIYRVVNETRTQGLPSGASITCREEQEVVIEAKVVGGRIDRGKKPPLLVNIELEVRDYVAENRKTCEVTPPGITLPTETEASDGHRAKWWRTALYNWPLKEGHSEVVGRFQYTLHINYRSECDRQLSKSMDELRQRFDAWVENCVKKSGVVTTCDTDMLRRCGLYIYGGDRDTSITEDCVESACGVLEDGLTQCLREALSLYLSNLITIEKQYRECMGK